MKQTSCEPPRTDDVDALLRLQDRLLHVARLATVGEMSTGIAHELNQPLCAMANYAQACDRLLQQPSPDIAEIRESLREIVVQALRAGDVIRRLRSLARPQQPCRDVTDINVLLGELTELIQSDAKHNEVRVQMQLGEGLPPVLADGAQIQQLVLNLVRNAIEALSDVPSSLREVVLSTVRTEQGDVAISVSDHGPGVAPRMEPHLFSPFSTTKPAGTGLGLAMSRTVARDHGGTLEYHANRPSGACFTLTLPGMKAAATHAGIVAA